MASSPIQPGASPSEPSKKWYGQPPPSELINNSSALKLLSQGAEGRVWLVALTIVAAEPISEAASAGVPSEPDNSAENDNKNKHKGTIHVGSGIHVPKLLSLTQSPSPLNPSETSATVQVICKERFPKKYRHPQLDVSLTKSRTKAEARCLIRCQRGGIPCPNVLSIAHWSNEVEKKEDGDSESGEKSENNSIHETGTIAACLFLEYVDGCTVRQYLEYRSTNETNSRENEVEGEPSAKRPKNAPNNDQAAEKSNGIHKKQRDSTVIDAQTLSVAHSLGTLVGKMHAAGVVHGDLTTSNVMLRNPPWVCKDSKKDTEWDPQLVLIDFGLATSTSSVLTNTKSTKQQSQKQNKQHFHAEEKAVDLYVLERAFLSTHPESEPLVEEVWKGYVAHFDGLDENDAENVEDSQKQVNKGSVDVGAHGQVAKAVMSRLEEVRKRGRKRECFG